MIESIKETFWKKYLDVLASDSKIMKYPCWYKQTKTPKVGDVVLVVYKSRAKDGYRIGKIVKVDEGGRNLDCLVSAHQKGGSKYKTNTSRMLVPTQRTVLLFSPDEHENSTIDEYKAITEKSQ